jgi:hypothetical protein
MRKEIEQRPVDTKILRENFRNGLQRKMNQLMNEGYVPVGGISTHMNTHTRPVLGIDSQEYTQTMVKYVNFEVWIKETDAERIAYGDEQRIEFLTTQIENLKKGATKELKQVKQLEDWLADLEKQSLVKKSFLGRIKHSIDTSARERRVAQLQATKDSLVTRKKNLEEAKEELDTATNRLAQFYKTNPSVTKDMLMSSR